MMKEMHVKLNVHFSECTIRTDHNRPQDGQVEYNIDEKFSPLKIFYLFKWKKSEDIWIKFGYYGIQHNEYPIQKIFYKKT